MFHWFYVRFRQCIGNAIRDEFAEWGVIDADATPEQVRAAIAGSVPAAVEDKPAPKRKEK